MNIDWRYSIGIGTFFFVAGQVLLRKSFDNSTNYIMSLLYFTMAISIMTVLGCVYQNENVVDFNNFNRQHYSAFAAGILFYIGFYFWIYSISTKNDLGIIRTFMAGFETLVLFMVGYLVFNDTISLLQSFGVLSILLGIYLIGNGH
jgi:multidrug transporter EmrE-like cation transporter